MFYFTRFICLITLGLLPSLSHAENLGLTAYFSNDSMNGFQISDAYETHNMGVRYASDQYYVNLDLGIVSPDMHVYTNEYREANRSYGEIVRLTYGRNISKTSSHYFNIAASGNFGLDKAQDAMHDFLGLQKTNAYTDLVRMPDSTWVGTGFHSAYQVNFDKPNTLLKLHGYAGTDKAFLDAKIARSLSWKNNRLTVEAGVRGVAYDEIVSANPINAKIRHVIPVAGLAIERKVGNATIRVSESLSLPKIDSDSSPFILFGASLIYQY